MNKKYDHHCIEKKWREIWEKKPPNKPDKRKKKFYCLDMFPYPSGAGLHVGHWRGYVLSDVLSRYKMLQGYQILHPMGWDAFGLPAENYAIQNGVHPSISTEANIQAMKKQLSELTDLFDWKNEINTTDPEYYKWTQWIFVKMFKSGLAYEKEMPLNWCPKCLAVLANEEAAGGICDRCGAPVAKKMLRQWMLRITDYAERLLNDLDKLDWPEKVKKMQSDWIGKSYGAEIDFEVAGSGKTVKVYTTRPDTLNGATFMVLAPEHEMVASLTTDDRKLDVEAYIHRAGTRSSVDRMADKEKTGAFTGSYCLNPLNGKHIPIWISDYVLVDYGTGAIMCVPGHDERDFEFAVKFGLPIVQVISRDGTVSELSEAYTDDGVLVNSGRFDGMKTGEAKDAIADYLSKLGVGKKTVNYKLRDWVFSRQRYWGEPIPIVHCDKCGAVPVKEEELPVLLPKVDKYLPTSTGESPLSEIDEWVNTICPECGGKAKRETNTMPQWAGSSWYFLRYPDNKNADAIASSEILKQWLPVDYYVGGVEHAVLHLLYSRFYTKFLYDIGVVEFDEPFTKLFNQGMINYNGKKMSKSSGQYVSSDEIVEKYGCDSLRMYVLFIGPPESDSEWDNSGIDGVYRFINRIWKLVAEYKDRIAPENGDFVRVKNKMIYDITFRLNNLTLNTVVSGFMEYSNKISELAKKYNGIDKSTLGTLITLLAPFAPHIAEEMWQETGHSKSVFEQSWPEYDEEKMKDDFITIAIQINGKLRDSIQVSADGAKDEVLSKAKDAVAKKLVGFDIVKEIYVPGKIVNLVIKSRNE